MSALDRIGSHTLPAGPGTGAEPGPAAARTTRSEWRTRLEESLLPPLVALLVAVVAGDLLILSFGQAPGAVWREMLQGTWGNWYGFGQVLYKTTALTFTGLGFAVAARAGLFNIGAEGQLAMGGFFAAVAGLLLPAATPALLAVAIAILAAMVGGGIVGWVPGVLRARTGAHEVIVTIMLNFIVLAFLNWIVASRLRVPETLHTPAIRAGMLPRLDIVSDVFRGSAANMALLLALAGAAATSWYLFRSRGGYELRAAGLQPEAAEAGGIRVGRVWIRAMTISGALAGLAGVNFVLGYKLYYEDGFGTGTGFLGIAVALIGRNNPWGIVASALLFATLSQGGLAINALVPKQIVDVLQGLVILAVAAATPEVRRLLRARPGGGGT